MIAILLVSSSVLFPILFTAATEFILFKMPFMHARFYI